MFFSGVADKTMGIESIMCLSYYCVSLDVRDCPHLDNSSFLSRACASSAISIYEIKIITVQFMTFGFHLHRLA